MISAGAAAARLSQLNGWRRAGALVALGTIATLALPPVQLVPLVWVSFTGLAVILSGARTDRSAFLDGFWFGWAHHAGGIYWIAYAMLVDPEQFGWMIPFAVLGLGAVLGAFAGLAAWLAWRATPHGVARILMLAAGWTFFEWVRGWIFTGFPWNLIGTVWVDTAPVAQLVSLIGIFGLSLVTVAVAAMPAVLAKPGRTGVVAVAASLIVLALATGWGAARIPASWPNVPDVRLRLVQPSIPQIEKWTGANRPQELISLIELSRKPAAKPVTDLVWPETAVPYFIDQDPMAGKAVADAAPESGLTITGAPRGTAPGAKPFQVWNSLEAVDHSGKIVAGYDKAHLVPFGEYVPLRGILPIAKLTGGNVDFSAGPGARTLDLPGLPPVSPLICYEAIFPAAVVDEAHRPGWMLNVTNDGWFGESAGPYQHFAAARFRAIEEGLPLVRDGNTGITAFVDPFGRVIASLPLGERGVLDGDLPVALDPTPFARWGNAIPLVLMVLVAAAAWALGRKSI